LFESFSQVDSSTTRNYGGSGLGLAISKRLVNLMGGEISVDSHVNKGSCFVFTISLLEASSRLVDVPAVQLEDWRVLIVDDNETNLDILKSHLENWGATITSTSHVDSALDILRLNQISGDTPPPPDFELIITDMHMPNKDGLSLTESVRQYYDNQALPILMLSSVSSQIASADLARLGLDGCLTKPVVTSDLYNAIALIGTNRNSNQRRLFVSEHALQRVNRPTISKVKWPDNARVLLVEDNHINRMVAEGLLEGMGMPCDFAEHGERAIEVLRTHSPDFYSVILMDCQMPVLDGYETTRQIRSGSAGEEIKRIPIIAMTANALKGDREKCLAAGMDDHIAKPIDVDNLRTRLQEALDAFECVFSERKTIDYDAQYASVSEPPESTVGLSIPDNLLTMDWHDTPPSLGEQPELFLKSLLVYIQQYKGTHEQFEYPVDNDDSNALSHVIHTIKGTSGNMGFVSVYEQAKLIEQQLQQNELQQSSLDQLKHLLQLSIRDAEQIINANHVDTVVGKADELSEVLQQLKPLLERSEVVPSHILEKLNTKPDSAFDTFARADLMLALDTFDYDTALGLIAR
jgi:CheY-like chemotaxis protein/HPt (histidine-containing phosphotransfer) domain-containing protein